MRSSMCTPDDLFREMPHDMKQDNKQIAPTDQHTKKKRNIINRLKASQKIRLKFK